MATASDALKPIEWSTTYTKTVGGLEVTFGVATQDPLGGPVVYGAALAERDLRKESCGYGVTEAEAAADLFRYMR